jgi:putative sigma-54 modulation protein
MKLTIQSVRFTASDHLKEYIQKKCDKLDQFFDRITDGEVILKVQNENKGANKFVEIILNVPGEQLISTEIAPSFEAATDQATDKLKTRIKRYKEKMRERTA